MIWPWYLVVINNLTNELIKNFQWFIIAFNCGRISTLLREVRSNDTQWRGGGGLVGGSAIMRHIAPQRPHSRKKKKKERKTALRKKNHIFVLKEGWKEILKVRNQNDVFVCTRLFSYKQGRIYLQISCHLFPLVLAITKNCYPVGSEDRPPVTLNGSIQITSHGSRRLAALGEMLHL